MQTTDEKNAVLKEFNLNFPKDQVTLSRDDIISGMIRPKLEYVKESKKIEKILIQTELKNYTIKGKGSLLFTGIMLAGTMLTFNGDQNSITLAGLALSALGIVSSLYCSYQKWAYNVYDDYVSDELNEVLQIEEVLEKNNL